MGVGIGNPGSLVVVDGSQGEGGGQILRTALSLSAVLGRPVLIENIRAHRPKPGLRPQHLTVVKALQTICGAIVEGGAVDSRRVVFRPGQVKAGNYSFDVGTAGSAILVLQALLLPLALTDGPSHIRLKGGTHVPWSPPYHYLSEVFLPTLALMGIKTEVRINHWGWYPKGRGEVEMDIYSIQGFLPLILNQPWRPDQLNILCASSNLPGHVAEREKQTVEALLRPRGFQAQYEIREAPAVGQGNLVFITARKGPAAAGFSSLGKKGKPAERVAEEAVHSFLSFLDSGAAMDKYLGDQVLPYLALAAGCSKIQVQGVSAHLRTNLEVVNRFRPSSLYLEELHGVGKVRTKSGCPDGKGNAYC